MTTFQKIVKYLAIALAVFIIVSIFSAIFGIAEFFSGEGVTDEIQAYEISENITSLDIEIGAADFNIVSGKSFSVESNLKHLTVTENNGTLVIKEDKKIGISYTDAVLTLYVPADYVFDKIELLTGAGRLNAESLSAKELEFELGAGEINIKQLNASSKAEIEGGAGALTIESGTLNDLSLEMGVGALQLTSAITGNSEINFGVGEADLTLLGAEDDYELQFEGGIGEAYINGEAIGNNKIYGNGKHRIDIEGGIGKVDIDFKEN